MIKAIIFDFFGVIRPDNLGGAYPVQLDARGNDPQLLTYVETLRKTYKTALLSNIGKGRLQELLGPGDLERYFDVALASGEIGYAKPDPRAYLLTAQKLGVEPSECLMVDDQIIHCEGARSVGMQAIVYTSCPQLKTDLETFVAKGGVSHE